MSAFTVSVITSMETDPPSAFSDPPASPSVSAPISAASVALMLIARALATESLIYAVSRLSI
jgi:hypothetical protein